MMILKDYFELQQQMEEKGNFIFDSSFYGEFDDEVYSFYSLEKQQADIFHMNFKGNAGSFITFEIRYVDNDYLLIGDVVL